MPLSGDVLLAAIALPFVAAVLVLPAYRWFQDRTAYLAAAVAAASFLGVTSQYGSEGTVSIDWIPAMDVSLSFYVDGLSILIGLLASGIGVLVFVYSAGYMDHEPGKRRYYATMLAFMGAMLGVAFASDLLALFLFWELTSITSFLLIGHYRDESGQYAARKSMLITVAGGLFMLVGFLVLRSVSADALGEATFRLAGDGSMIAAADVMRDELASQGLLLPVVLLIGVGAAAKSAQVPLHIWLPNAMEAPTPVSAFLHSATMVKAGVYLVGRFRPLLFGDEWLYLFVLLGLVTMTAMAIMAVGATDLKELLAYSTASHLGLIVAGFGLSGAVGAETGAFHIVNHALFKAPLFFVAGIVAHQAGTRALSELGGLWRDLPLTGAITVVAALGMAGLPPFNGFYSKELLFEATYHAFEAHGGMWWVLPALAVFGSIFTFLYSIRFLLIFFGDRPAELGDVRAAPRSMQLPALILAGLAGIVGLGGVASTFGVHLGVTSFVGQVVDAITVAGTEAHFGYHLPTELSPAVLMSATTIGLGALAYPAYDRIAAGIRRLRSFEAISPNAYYDGITRRLDHSTAIEYVQTGRLRTAAIWIVLSTSVIALAGYLAAGAGVTLPETIALTAPMTIVLAVAIGAAVALLRAPSHIAGVLVLSILGFMIAIFYILADAPDLALTQLVVETLVLLVFLLVIDRLPVFYGESARRRVGRDAVVAGIVGVTVAVTVLLTTANDPGLPAYLSRTLPEFFVQRGGVPAEHGTVVLDHGGGHNIVNVILVDFRALDTMGEISVVAMAALSVITLLAMREGGEAR